MQKVTVILDLGNSQTRALVSTGEIDTESRKSHILQLDNRFSNPFRLISSRLDPEKYDTDNSLMFEVKDTPLNGHLISQKVVYGLLAEYEYGMTYSSPDVSIPKYRNTATVFNTINALYRTLEWIKKENNSILSISDLAQGVEFSLTVLLPPEQAVQQKNLIEDLKNITPVHFDMTDETIQFNVNNVTIQQEGYTAFYGTFIDRRTRKPRASLANAIIKKILLIDIGQGTTDIMIIDNMKAIESSKRTFPIGGSNVHSATRAIVSKETGLSFDTKEFVSACNTGLLDVGNTQKEISEYVNESKFNVAYKIVSEIKEYLLANQINPTSLKYVLVVGGGTMESENKDIKSLGSFIHNHFQDLTPETDLIDINTVETATLMMGKDEMFSARTVNLLGAGILTDIRELKKETK